MSKFTYRATPEGNLEHIKKGTIIKVASFDIIKGGRGDAILVTKQGGGIKRVNRFQVDETDFSFGPSASGDGASGKAQAASSKKGAIPAGASSNGRSISLTREEAVDLLHVVRNLDEVLTNKLIEETI